MVDAAFVIGSMVLLVMTTVLISATCNRRSEPSFEDEMRRGYGINTDPPKGRRAPPPPAPSGRYTSPAPPPKKPQPPRIVIVCGGRIIQE